MILSWSTVDAMWRACGWPFSLAAGAFHAASITVVKWLFAPISETFTLSFRYRLAVFSDASGVTPGRYLAEYADDYSGAPLAAFVGSNVAARLLNETKELINNTNIRTTSGGFSTRLT
jgi:hypothetical protein